MDLESIAQFNSRMGDGSGGTDGGEGLGDVVDGLMDNMAESIVII